MLYPQGKIIHQNLSAEYTDVPQLLNSLSANGFSGTIEVEAGDRKGAFFVAGGRVVNAAIGLESDPPAMVGEPAMQELYLLARQPKGLLHVAELSAAEIEILTAPFSSELVFKDLSTDFIRMEQFVIKLSNEKHTGYVEIFSKTGTRIGTLLFRDGEMTGFQMISGSGNTNVYEGEAIASAIAYAVRNGAVFNVYRDAASRPPDAPSRDAAAQEATSETTPEIAPPGGDLKFETEPSVPPQPEPEPQAKPVVELSFTDKLVEELARIEEPQRVTAEAEPAQVDEASMSHRTDFISDLQRVLSKLESFTDHIGSKGDFQRLFRHNCVEKSEEFHFLDPFEGQFNYDSGKINLSADVGSEEFAIGTASCLNIVLTSLNKDFLKGAALPPGLKGEIETAFRNYKDVIKNSGLQSIVPVNMR